MAGPVLSHRQRFDESNARSVTNLVSALQAIKAAKDEKEAQRRAGVQDQLAALQVQQGQQSVAQNEMALGKQREEAGVVSAFNDQINREMNPGAMNEPAMPGMPSAFDVSPRLDNDAKAKGDRFKAGMAAKWHSMHGQLTTQDQVLEKWGAASAQNADVMAQAADAPKLRELERGIKTATIGQINANAASGRYSPIPLEGGGIGRFNTKTGAVEDTGSRGVPKAGGNPDNLLPLDVKKQIEVLSSKSAGKVAIANQLESDLIQLRDAMGLDAEGKPVAGKKPNEDLAYSYAQNMLKTMNSKEGADAVGVDEAKRAAGLLDYNTADIEAGLGMKPGKFHGRDMIGFLKQVSSNVEGIKGSVEFNKKEIDRLYGRKPTETPAGSSKFKILSVE